MINENVDTRKLPFCSAVSLEVFWTASKLSSATKWNNFSSCGLLCHVC